MSEITVGAGSDVARKKYITGQLNRGVVSVAKMSRRAGRLVWKKLPVRF